MVMKGPEECMTFGEVLKQLRDTSGLTQFELADRAGISRWHWSRMEQGKIQRPRLSTVVRALSALRAVTTVTDKNMRDLLEASGHHQVDPSRFPQLERRFVRGARKRTRGQAMLANAENDSLSRTQDTLQVLMQIELSPDELTRLDDSIADYIGYLIATYKNPDDA